MIFSSLVPVLRQKSYQKFKNVPDSDFVPVLQRNTRGCNLKNSIFFLFFLNFSNFSKKILEIEVY
jgi:hypothetical protein